MNTARSEGSVSTYQGYLDTLPSLCAVFCTLAQFSRYFPVTTDHIAELKLLVTVVEFKFRRPL